MPAGGLAGRLWSGLRRAAVATASPPAQPVPETAEIDLPSGGSVHLVLERRARARRAALRVDPAARVVRLSAPLRMSAAEAFAFARREADFIERRLAALPPATPFAEGACIPILGETVRISAGVSRGPAQLDGPPGDRTLVIGCAPADRAAPERFARRVEAALKAMAHSAALSAVEACVARGGQRPAALALRDARGRWGSCSASGRVMLSWRLIGAPASVLAYVVAHELAHLRHMDHSPAFWAEVARLHPDWRVDRSWLKTHGARLHALGAA